MVIHQEGQDHHLQARMVLHHLDIKLHHLHTINLLLLQDMLHHIQVRVALLLLLQDMLLHLHVHMAILLQDMLLHLQDTLHHLLDHMGIHQDHMVLIHLDLIVVKIIISNNFIKIIF